MKLSTATNYFKKTPFDGWDGSIWTPEVIRGDFHTYDRFISDRSFGQKKRILTTGTIPLGASYQALRLADGTRYLVGSSNVDMYDAIYNYIYQLEEAPFDCEIIEIQTSTLASGIAGAATEVVTGNTFCDVERVSSHASKEFTDLEYVEYEITMPLAMSSLITADRVLKIDSVKYNIKEASQQINLLACRASKRGG